LISPLPIKLTYQNGDTEDMMIPAEIWRRNSRYVTKLIIRKKRIKSIELDPAHQTADADYSNNSFPPVMRPGRLKMYKSDFKKKSMMADMLTELKSEEEKDKPEGSDKDMPMKDTSEKDTSKSYGSGSDGKAEMSGNKSDEKIPEKKMDDKTGDDKIDTAKKSILKSKNKKKNSLRRTLEKMMGKE